MVRPRRLASSVASAWSVESTLSVEQNVRITVMKIENSEKHFYTVAGG